MHAWFRSPRVRRSGSILFLLLTPLACQSWQTPKQPLPETLAAKPNAKYRVTLVHGNTVELVKPYLAGDSLIGTVVGDVAPELRRFAAPVTDVSAVEVRQVSTGRTVLLVAGVVAVVAVTAAGMAAMATTTFESPDTVNWLGSCPVVYSWDGTTWRLDSGTFGGAITRGAQRTDVDNLPHLATRNGVARIQVRNELQETDYVDALAILAVDHPPGTSVLPDGAGALHTVGTPLPPQAASDFRGRDVLPQVLTADDRVWESVLTGRDSARAADTQDGLELAFPLPPGQREAQLVLEARNTPWAMQLQNQYLSLRGPGLQAWYDSLDASPPMLRRVLGRLAADGFLHVMVDSAGSWVPRGTVWEIGPEVAKRVVVPLRLAGITGAALRVRLVSAPAFWHVDYVGLDTAVPGEVQVTRLLPEGRAANQVRAVDGAYLTLEPGDREDFQVAAPAVPAGKTRSWVLESTGWYRLHIRPAATADAALLNRFDREPGLAGKVSVAWLNQALAALASQAR
jgi:hypothetical protein